jgi:sugar-specific transcriptional regulator TrmB
MINIKEEAKNKQSNNIKEETKEFLDNQRQQLANTTSTISESTNSINEYQKTNKAILEKSIDISNKYQQTTINIIQSISNNYIELQNNILNTYQSAFLKFINDSTKSYWNNYIIPKQHYDAYNKNNQNIIDNTINATRKSHELILTSTETFNKSIEIAQKYYNESVQNYFNFANKIRKSYYSY